MTFPCKENLIYFEQLAKTQRALFDDAADFGVWRTEEALAKDRAELKELIDFYGAKTTKWGNRDSRGPYGSNTEVCIPIEYDEGKISCEILTVNYNFSAMGRMMFGQKFQHSLEIMFSREYLDEAEMKRKYNAK